MSTEDEIVERALDVLERRPSALVTDVDGTLAQIVANPQDATVSIEIKEALRRLLPRLDVLAVVTGRERAVARRIVGVQGLTYIGSYAIAASETPIRVTDEIREAREEVLPYLPRFACVTMELKEVSFALHYRGCDDPETVRVRLKSLLEPIAANHEAKLVEGKQVLEVVPRDLPDKGTAFAALLGENGIAGSVFVGDDLSDVTIFDQIRSRRGEGLPGLAVAVVDDETPLAAKASADVSVDGVMGVERFLVKLAERLAALRTPLV